jgi:hypothetical protein
MNPYLFVALPAFLLVAVLVYAIHLWLSERWRRIKAETTVEYLTDAIRKRTAADLEAVKRWGSAG